jgi:hypothetical protein
MLRPTLTGQYHGRQHLQRHIMNRHHRASHLNVTAQQEVKTEMKEVKEC